MKLQRRCRMTGFSLLEVMIAAVVLSFGLLGLVAMQATAKFSSYEARQRTIASWLANDLVERVRINKDSWSAQSIAVVSSAAPNLPTCASNDGTMAGCSRSDRQALDLFYWQRSLMGTAVSGAISGAGASLQSPVGCVIRGANNSLTVGIFWRGRQSLSDGSGSVTAVRNSCGLNNAVDRQRRQFVLTTTL
ncbi:type IV pilus modification protein PilV [Aeromonas lusitana]|uniref:Type IV pilus modification protein PilV n=1 Tax=Aeromonas lusitana TaxID=931529 RepID=A0A2M8H4I9_9GAMM|nr:type IV pilus modification protein PilV [Aeromonas lusitana]PJC91457.1 type IV pilus modification protein PilV [Aeromonas lusitana]